jgi:arylsulfatase A-like enzyme
LIHEAGNQASIIQGQYKLIRPRGDTKSSGSSKKKKRKKEPVTMLFDLNTDPAEQNNLANVRPQLVKKLNALLTAERVDEPAGFANTYHTWNAKPKMVPLVRLRIGRSIFMKMRK